MTEEEVEAAALESMANMGSPRQFWLPHPKTGVIIHIDLDKPTDEAVEVLQLLYGDMKDT